MGFEPVTNSPILNSGTHLNVDDSDGEKQVEKSTASTETKTPTPPSTASLRQSHKMPTESVPLADRHAEILGVPDESGSDKSRTSRILRGVRATPGRAYRGARNATSRVAGFVGNGIAQAWQKLRPGSAASATPDPVATNARVATTAAFAAKFGTEDTSSLSRNERSSLIHAVETAIRTAGIDPATIGDANLSYLTGPALDAFYDSKNELKDFPNLAQRIPNGAVASFTNLQKIVGDGTAKQACLSTALNALDIHSESTETGNNATLRTGCIMAAMVDELSKLKTDDESFDVIKNSIQAEIQQIFDDTIQQIVLAQEEAVTLVEMLNKANAVAEKINNPTEFGEKVHADVVSIRNDLSAMVAGLNALTAKTSANAFVDTAVQRIEGHLTSLDNLEEYSEQFDDIAALDILRKLSPPLSADQHQEAADLVAKLGAFVGRDPGSSVDFTLEQSLKRDLLISMQAKANHSVIGMEKALAPVPRDPVVQKLIKPHRIDLTPEETSAIRNDVSLDNLDLQENGMSEVFIRDLAGCTFTFGDETLDKVGMGQEAEAVAQFDRILNFTGGDREAASLLTTITNQGLLRPVNDAIRETSPEGFPAISHGPQEFNVQKSGDDYVVTFTQSARLQGVSKYNFPEGLNGQAVIGETIDLSANQPFSSTQLTVTLKADRSVEIGSLAWTVSEAPTQAHRNLFGAEATIPVIAASPPSEKTEASIALGLAPHHAQLLEALGLKADNEVFASARKAGLLTPDAITTILAADDPVFTFTMLVSGGSHAAKKAKTASENKTSNNAVINLALPTFGLQRKEVAGDGDCFYTSVSGQLASENGKPKTALDVRKDMHNHLDNLLKNHPENDGVWDKLINVGTRVDIQKWIDNEEILHTASRNKAVSAAKAKGNEESFDEEKVKVKGAWATAEYAQLAAILYDRPVILFNGRLAQASGDGALFETHFPDGPHFTDHDKNAAPDAMKDQAKTNLLKILDEQDPIVLIYDGVNHFDAASRTADATSS